MPPLLIAAGVTAAATVGGALLSSGAQKSAADTAAQTAQNNTNANNALATNIYNQNNALLSPYVNRGNAAGDQINALLGIGSQPQAAAPTSPYQPATGYSGSGAANFAPANDLALSPGSLSAKGLPIRMGAPLTASTTQYGVPPNALAQTTGPASPASSTSTAANDALTNFADSAGMQFQLQQGEKAINQGYGAAGTLQSGAALKALQGFGQQTALSNYFMPYIGLLQGQQGVGASAGSAVAGVGNNLVTNVTSNNNAAASTAAQAAIASGNSTAQMYGAMAGGVGTFANALASSYKAAPPPPPVYGM